MVGFMTCRRTNPIIMRRIESTIRRMVYPENATLCRAELNVPSKVNPSTIVKSGPTGKERQVFRNLIDGVYGTFIPHVDGEHARPHDKERQGTGKQLVAYHAIDIDKVCYKLIGIDELGNPLISVGYDKGPNQK